MAGVKYTLSVLHNGTDLGDFCVYQTYEKQDEDIRSLAWFSKTAHPGTKLEFNWTIEYSFAWSEQGVLIPGVVFKASQNLPTDPTDVTQNTIGFAKEKGAYLFKPSENPTNPGKMGIVCENNIPANSASIGIGMSGKAAYACIASPSLKYTFAPHPKYWIAFGKFEEGEVLDVNRMTERFEINYPVNKYDREIVLKPDNTWAAQD